MIGMQNPASPGRMISLSGPGTNLSTGTPRANCRQEGKPLVLR
jgi:hypothetical protein